jgi:hypothetical protein
LELNGGYIINHFHDFGYDKEGPHYKSEYQNGSGYGFLLGIEDLTEGIFRYRFTLAYFHYGGQFYTYASGLGSGVSVDGSVNKSLISLGLYPLGFKILRKIDLNIGFEIGALLHEDFSGNSSCWSISPSGCNYTTDLNEKNDRLSALFYFGLSSRIAYNIKIINNLYISPQYSFYLGLSPEFAEYSKKTRSMRHYFSLGIKKQLRKGQ